MMIQRVGYIFFWVLILFRSRRRRAVEREMMLRGARVFINVAQQRWCAVLLMKRDIILKRYNYYSLTHSKGGKKKGKSRSKKIWTIKKVVLFRVPASLSFAFLLSLCFSSLFCPLDSKFFANSFHLSKSHDPRHFFISPFSLQPTLLSLFVSLYL